MHTIASLKKEYKTLAAVKAAFKVKARSWAELVEKINKPSVESLQAEIDRLKAEITALKQNQPEPEYQSDYFKSAEAELIYSIVNLDGEDRLRALQVTRSHYSNAKKAKDWRNQLANKVHPDKCRHPQAQAAATKIVEMYKSMVA